MSDKAFGRAIKNWLEREAGEMRGRRPLPRTEQCLSWREAYELARDGSWDALPEATRRHIGECEDCRRLVNAFESALGESSAAVTAARENGESAMGGPSIWESVREGVQRLKGALEVSLTGTGGPGGEWALAYAWRGPEQGGQERPVLGRRPEEGGQGGPGVDVEQSPSSVRAVFDFPDLGAGLELEVEKGEPPRDEDEALVELSVQVRPYFPEAEAPIQDLRVAFRRWDGEEVMTCWLSEGDTMLIPKVEGGQFVVVVTNPDIPSIYEIPVTLVV